MVSPNVFFFHGVFIPVDLIQKKLETEWLCHCPASYSESQYSGQYNISTVDNRKRCGYGRNIHLRIRSLFLTYPSSSCI